MHCTVNTFSAIIVLTKLSTGTDENQNPKTLFEIRKIPTDGAQISEAQEK